MGEVNALGGATGAAGAAKAGAGERARTDPSKTFVAVPVDISKTGGKELEAGLALDRAGHSRQAMLQYDSALVALYTRAFGAAPTGVPKPPSSEGDTAGWVRYDRESLKFNDEVLKAFHKGAASPDVKALVRSVETAVNRKSVAYNHLDGHQPEAIAGYKSLLHFDKHFGPARYNEAVSLLKSGLPKDAIQTLAKALASDAQPAVPKANVRGDKDWALLPPGLRAELEKLTR